MSESAKSDSDLDVETATEIVREHLQGCTVRYPVRGTHKGTEVRLWATDEETESLLREALTLFGVRPGRAFRKVNGLIIPVYGVEAARKLLRLLGGKRGRAALERLRGES